MIVSKQVLCLLSFFPKDKVANLAGKGPPSCSSSFSQQFLLPTYIYICTSVLIRPGGLDRIYSQKPG